MSISKHEKISLGTKEIAKRIREQLKVEFPACKFSVVSEYYSGGSSITVALMRADRKVKLRFEEIPEKALCSYRLNRYTEEELRHYQGANYHQLGHFYDDYNPDSWVNGVFLTYQGYMLLKRVEQIANYYNFDDSDSMIDYYSVNFSFSLHLGKWNDPFIDGLNFKADPVLETNIKKRLEQVKVDVIKEKAEERLRQIEADQYRATNKLSIPSGATHVIDGSGLRLLTLEERETGQSKEKLEEKWFKNVNPTNWKNFTLEV